MSRSYWFAAVLVAVSGLVVLSGAVAISQTAQESKPAVQPQPKLPAGWTEDDIKAFAEASTPGKMHEHLAKGIGEWLGKSTVWMSPDSEPLKSECTSTVTSVMDGRFTKCEIKGEMPGMGPYHAVGYYGYDNVSKEFVSTFIDNHSTGVMNGVGELSRDGKKTTWKYTFHCPITKKPAVLREVETVTGPNTKTLESFGQDPKSGKEFKMMSIQLTRK